METTNTIKESASELESFGTSWAEPGALVIRQHLDTNPIRPAFDEPEPCDLDLSQLDEGFVSFVKRYTQRCGHVPFGVVFQMADAWGIDVQGNLALADAVDPNLILWQRSSQAFLAHLVYLIQHDPDDFVTHETSPTAAADGCLTPAMATADHDLYNAKQAQTEPRWLPATFCTERAGIGLEVNSPAAGGIAQALAEALADLPANAVNVTVKVARLDREGNITGVQDLSDYLKNGKADPSDDGFNA